MTKRTSHKELKLKKDDKEKMTKRWTYSNTFNWQVAIVYQAEQGE